MIFEDDIERLSGLKPKQKFYKIEELARRRLEESRQCANINEPLPYNEYDYATAVAAAADAYGIEKLAEFKLPWLVRVSGASNPYFKVLRKFVLRSVLRKRKKPEQLASLLPKKRSGLSPQKRKLNL